MVKMKLFNCEIGENGVKLKYWRVKWMKWLFQVPGFRLPVTSYREIQNLISHLQ
jgi:hypothetical protein